MSRALDPETVAALHQDPQSAYNDIVEALNTKTEDLLEIEFLSTGQAVPEGCNVLVDGNYIAVPKVKLVQAFVVARKTFFQYVRECPDGKEDELQNSTAIILLMDPEHLTAANTRKRFIQKHLFHPRCEVEAILKHELYFVDSYLTSRLHRHTKSPTLWGHRRWVLEASKSIQMEHSIQSDLKSVVLVAAERHPRNYYAWSHMRWLLEAFSDTICSRTTIDCLSNDHAEMVYIVKDWCLRHPSDTSGFSFLLFYVLHTASTDSRIVLERTTERSAICKEVLRLAVSFKWTHESVWVFLRTLVASEATLEKDTDFYGAIASILTDDPEGKPAVKAARDWCVMYQQKE